MLTIGPRGGELFDVMCKSCGISAQVRKQKTKNKWGWFCSRICYGKFRSKNSHLFVQNTSLMHTPDVAKKISEIRKKQTSKIGYVHSQTGLKRTQETKDKISKKHKESGKMRGKNNPMFGHKHTKETKELQSVLASQRIIDGIMPTYASTRHKKGTYLSTKMGVEYFFKSSWEEAVMKYLDDDQQVKSWSYESLRIPYYYDSHKRWYVPDFIVTFSNSRKELWEIKPKQFVDSERMLLKAEAARNYCFENYISKYVILTSDDLKIRHII